MNIDPSNVEAIAENIMNSAVENLLGGENLIPVHFLLTPQGMITVPLMDNRLTPKMVHPLVCKMADKMDAFAIFFVMEAWSMDARKKDPNKRISDHDDRGEMVVVVMATRQGEKALMSHFTRPGEGIIDVGKPEWLKSEMPLFEPFWSQHAHH